MPHAKLRFKLDSRRPGDVHSRAPNPYASQLVLAPIRTGVGLRLGANVGYLKFTREPSLNPF